MLISTLILVYQQYLEKFSSSSKIFSIFNMIFIKDQNFHHMTNNTTYKGNIDAQRNTSTTIF